MHGIMERKPDYEFKDMLSSHDLATVEFQTSNLFPPDLISKI